MKRFFLTAFACMALFFLNSRSVQAQDQDSTVFFEQFGLDRSMAGKDILTLLKSEGKSGGSIVVNQSYSLTRALRSQVNANVDRRTAGYRIRIFFDNSQNARNRSSSIQASFNASYPDIHAYRSYENPYFKVTVGDFRTKSDALRFMDRIRSEYPSVFLVREDIRYPIMMN